MKNKRQPRQTWKEFIKEAMIEQAMSIEKERQKYEETKKRISMKETYDYYMWKKKTGEELTEEQQSSLKWLDFALKRPDKMNV